MQLSFACRVDRITEAGSFALGSTLVLWRDFVVPGLPSTSKRYSAVEMRGMIAVPDEPIRHFEGLELLKLFTLRSSSLRVAMIVDS